MNYDAVIAQLKAYAPMFNGNVAGAADYDRAVQDQVWLPPPAAYVRPLDEEAEPNTSLNSLRQLVTERFGVIVIFDNSADRRGQTVTSLYDGTRAAIWRAILNWSVDPVRASRGIEYGGGQLLAHDRARLLYQWEFTLQITVSAADGWQITADPLLEIDAQLETPTGQTLADATFILPQS